jgi:hypothetical protein
VDRRRRRIDSAKGSEEGSRRRRERRVTVPPQTFSFPLFFFSAPPHHHHLPHVGGVGDKVRGRAERKRISWEDKDNVIGQEGLGTILGTEREDVIGGMKIEDDKNGEDERRKSEEETVIGSESGDERRLCEKECVIEGESCDEVRDRDGRVMIGREEAANGRSVGKGSWVKRERTAEEHPLFRPRALSERMVELRRKNEWGRDTRCCHREC